MQGCCASHPAAASLVVSAGQPQATKAAKQLRQNCTRSNQSCTKLLLTTTSNPPQLAHLSRSQLANDRRFASIHRPFARPTSPARSFATSHFCPASTPALSQRRSGPLDRFVPDRPVLRQHEITHSAIALFAFVSNGPVSLSAWDSAWPFFRVPILVQGLRRRPATRRTTGLPLLVHSFCSSETPGTYETQQIAS